MPAKTHRTAVVAMPPPEVWEPIQAIRRQHDRNVQRWMPHITFTAVMVLWREADGPFEIAHTIPLAGPISRHDGERGCGAGLDMRRSMG